MTGRLIHGKMIAETSAYAAGFDLAAFGGAGPKEVAGAVHLGAELMEPNVSSVFCAWVGFHFKTHQATPWSLVQSP